MHAQDSDVNRLLAPNSIEDRSARAPPQTPSQLYARLAELLVLEVPKGVPALAATPAAAARTAVAAAAGAAAGVRAPPAAAAGARRLALRRPLVRLLRETRKVCDVQRLLLVLDRPSLSFPACDRGVTSSTYPCGNPTPPRPTFPFPLPLPPPEPPTPTPPPTRRWTASS